MLNIAIDIMGGDNAPAEPIKAIRSYLKLPISFPTTTGVKNDCTGGEAFKFKEQ